VTRAAGAVVFRRTERGVRLLVLRISATWDFPNGRLAPGETEFAAAQRETAEQTGLADLDFPFGDAHRDALPSAGGRIAAYYLAETDEAEIDWERRAPGETPHDEWRWVSFDEAEDLLPPRLALVLDWARATIDGP
jgi:8-oxo-dGTP pyrophosphatase MutT (NUDIX family)